MGLVVPARAGRWVIVRGGRIGIITDLTPSGATVHLQHPYFGTFLKVLKNVPYEDLKLAKYRNIPAKRRPKVTPGNSTFFINSGYLTEEEVSVMLSPKPIAPPTKIEFIRGGQDGR